MLAFTVAGEAAMRRCLLIVSFLCTAFFAGGHALAGDAASGEVEPPAQPVKTGKERLSDKASDEQRVDDCNVPPERRGARLRPTACDGGRQPVAPASGRKASPE